MKLFSYCVAILLLVGASAQVFGQGATAGKEHEWLKENEGEWDLKMEVGGAQAPVGTCTYKMTMGGLWLVCDVQMDMEGTKFTGHGIDGYDPAKKKYIAIWTDSMSAAPIICEGDLSADKKTLTMTGKGPSPTGEIAEIKMVTEYKDKDHHTFKMWMGDTKGEPMMTLLYTRKKK